MTATGPFLPLAGDAITQSLEHKQSVLVQPATGPAFPLEVEDLEVGFSEDWAPHVEVSMRAKVPEDVAQIDTLDPRAGCRLLVSLGYIYGDRTEDVHQVADVALQSRQVSRPSNELSLTGVSAEAQLQDYRILWNPSIPSAGLNELMDWCLRFGLAPKAPKVNSTLPAGYGKAGLAGIEAQIGSNYWDVIEDAAQRTDAWVYCDGDDTWQITKKPLIAVSPHLALTVGENGTIISTQSTLDREPWANALVITYEWTDANKDRRIIHGRAVADSGPFSIHQVGYRVQQVSRQTAVTQAQADQAAAGMLRNLISRGRSLTLEAIAAYWVRPGNSVDVTLPTGETERHLVQSVRFRPGDGTMTLTTRQPVDLTITTGE